MADKRAFAKFDVGYLDNPKMMDVLDRSSDAIIMHFASVLYCSQHLTDGVVASKAMQRKSGATSDDVQILIEAGLWHGPNHSCESCPQPPAGKVYVHDFLEHNREAAAAKRVSAKRSEAANRRWAKEKEPMQIALQTEGVCNAEREREKEITTTSKPDGLDKSVAAAEFDHWYSKYPKKEAKEAARKAFTKARRTASVDSLESGLARYVEAVKGKDRQFIALPATWLNAGRWDDEPTQQPKSAWTKEFHNG